MNSTHRQYEALRAFFVDKVPPAEAAQRFGYGIGAFNCLLYQFRKDHNRPYFIERARGRHVPHKKERARTRIIALRKKNLSVYDIQSILTVEGHPLSAPVIAAVLREAGYSRLPRRNMKTRIMATH